MKKNLLLTILLAVLLLPAMSQIAFTTEPDTIWTTGARAKSYFTPDGLKYLTLNHCYNVSDGQLVWDRSQGYTTGIFSQDSLYFYDDEFAKFRISDGIKIAEGPSFEFNTLPDFFHDSSLIWAKPQESLYRFMMSDEDTYYYSYTQDSLNYHGEYVASQSLLCKYDKTLDSIVLYTPLVLGGTDTVIQGSAVVLGYIPDNNTILVKFDDRITYHQYNANTLELESQFIYDEEKYGWVNEQKISYNGKYLGMGTTDGESKLGWIIIYDLTTNSIYNKFLDTDSSTSDGSELIAFSRNDSFLVAMGGTPPKIKTWNFHTGTLIHAYDEDYWAQWSLDVSPDNTKIIASSLKITSLLRARWTPVTSVEEEKDEPEMMLVYPNPGTDEVRINLTDHSLKGVVESVRVFNVLGIEHPATSWHPSKEGNIRLDVSYLSPGVYFVQVGDRIFKFVKM